jgi:O-antigen/teichoic acid export membrane protein
MAYSQIDRLLLGAMAASSELGWYAAANRIATIPIFIPTMIITPLFPALSRSLQQPQELRRGVAQTLRYTLFLTAPLAAGTIALAPAIPPLLGWPADFANSVRPMQILALQLPLISSGMVLGATLMAVGRERRMVGLATVATALNVALNLVAIPASQHVFGSGAIGAAVVSVVSETVMLIGAIAFLPTGLLDPGVLWVAIRITSAGVAVAVVASACLSVAGMMASVAAGATTYVALTVPMRILGIEDVRLLTSRFLRRPG